MPPKRAIRDNVNAVRSQLLHLPNLTREQIESALLYYESNIDATVEAFKRDGAVEALGGWTQMPNGRGNAASRRTNNRTNDKNKPSTLNTSSSVKNPPSNRTLRPSERVSNIFQIFAEGGTPTISTNGSVTTSNTTACSPSSISSSSLIEQVDNHQDLPVNEITVRDDTTEQKPASKSESRKNSQSRHESTSSATRNPQSSTNNDNHQTTTVHISNNRKLLTKSVKDLQRQTSTITNVEILFENEIKSSIKRIDEMFKQIHDIIKQREVELYLEMDKAKEQGLNVIHSRQKRAVELRQRIDRCDRLEAPEIDNLRHDIKQFVTDRRYELGEELATSHRFEYDQNIIETLKNFGRVLPIGRTRTTSSVVSDNNASALEKSSSDVTSETPQISTVKNRILSISSTTTEGEVFKKAEEPLPQRINKTQQMNGEVKNTSKSNHLTGDNHQNCNSSQQTNNSFQYYDETNNYQNGPRRRTPQYSQGNAQRPRQSLNYYNDNSRRNRPKQTNNSKPANTYNRPRPPPNPSKPIVSVQT